jgi:hypothetical protein
MPRTLARMVASTVVALGTTHPGRAIARRLLTRQLSR